MRDVYAKLAAGTGILCERLPFARLIKARAGCLLVLEDPFVNSIRRQIIDLAMQYRLPASYGSRDYTEAGGLVSYGPDRRQMYRRVAEYVDKILKGAKPADLPVEQPTRFELVINIKPQRRSA